jgi:hypothetical protein
VVSLERLATRFESPAGCQFPVTGQCRPAGWAGDVDPPNHPACSSLGRRSVG